MQRPPVQAYWFLLAGLLASPVHADTVRRVVSLDGLWGFALDAEDVGLKRGWAAKPPALRSVSLPSCWEENGLATDYDGVAWYYKRLDLRGVPRDAVARVRFAGVSYGARVFIDGRPAAEHDGAYEPFEALVPPEAAGRSAALLAVRVDDRRAAEPEAAMESRLQPGRQGPSGARLKSGLRWTSGQDFGGVWQPVELTVTGPAYLVGVRAEARADLSALVCVTEVTAQAIGCRVEHAILDEPGGLVLSQGNQGQPPISLVADASDGVSSPKSVAVPGFEVPLTGSVPLWSPDSPSVVCLRTRLSSPTGEVLDVLEQPVAVRHISVRDGRVCLNGRPVFAKVMRYNGRYPTSQARPPSDEFLRRDLAMIREAGINALEFSPSPIPEWLSLAANRAGLMPLDTRAGDIARLSLPRVQFGGIGDMAEMADRQAKMEQTWPKPSQAATTFARTRDTIDAGLELFPFPVPGEIRGPARPNVAISPEQRRRHFYEDGLDLQAEWLRRAVDEIRLQREGAGLIVASWEDWAGSLGPGIVTIFREPKPSYRALADALAPRRCIVRVEPGMIPAGGNVAVRVSLVADDPAAVTGHVAVVAIGPSRERLTIVDRPVEALPAPPVEAEFRPTRPGLWRIQADAALGERESLAGHAEVLVLDEAEEPDIRGPIELLVDAPELRARLESWGVPVSAYDPEASTPTVIVVPGMSATPVVGFEARVQEARALAARGCVLVFLAQADRRAFGPVDFELVDPVGPLRMGMTVLSADGPFDGLRASAVLDRVPGAEALLPTSVLTWPQRSSDAASGATKRRNLAPHFGPEVDQPGALPLWGSALLLDPTGSGYIVYCQIPVEEHLDHPGSRRLLKNLLGLAERLLPTTVAPRVVRQAESGETTAAPTGGELTVQVSDPVNGPEDALLAAHFRPARGPDRGPSARPSDEGATSSTGQPEGVTVVEAAFRDQTGAVRGGDVVIPLPTPNGVPLGEEAVVCVLMSVYSPERTIARLTISHEEPFRAWLDGRAVSRDPSGSAVDLEGGWHELRLNAALPHSPEGSSIVVRFAPAGLAASPPLGGGREIVEAEQLDGSSPERAVSIGPGEIVIRHGIDARLEWRLPALRAGRYDLWMRYHADRPTPLDIEIPNATLQVTAPEARETGWAWMKLGRVPLAPELNLAFGPRPVPNPRTIYHAPQMTLRHRTGELTIDHFVFAADGWTPEGM